MTPTKVLYIGGTGRTGSTLLDKLLGQVPGVFAGGELAFLWRYGLRDGGRCSCGEPIATCPVWGAALQTAFGPGGVDADEMVALRRRAQSVHLPLMVSQAAQRRLLARLGPFPERVEALYRALVATTGARLLVDSSKEPHYSWILRSRPGLDVRFLHLVRDPRAIAHSWSRHRPERGFDSGVAMDRRGPAVSAIYHDVSNAAAELLWRDRPGSYARLRYEDLLSDPRGSIRRIEELIEEPLPLEGVLEGRIVNISSLHSAWGNPNRFERGRIELRPDTEWENAMSARNRRIVTTMTLPFLHRYGYPVRAGHGQPADTAPAGATR